MENNQTITIPIEYLKEVIDYSGRSLVGKLLKRFEILEDRNALKSEARELIYEEMRKLGEILNAYEKVRVFTAFEFKTKNGV